MSVSNESWCQLSVVEKVEKLSALSKDDLLAKWTEWNQYASTLSSAQCKDILQNVVYPINAAISIAVVKQMGDFDDLKQCIQSVMEPTNASKALKVSKDAHCIVAILDCDGSEKEDIDSRTFAYASLARYAAGIKKFVTPQVIKETSKWLLKIIVEFCNDYSFKTLIAEQVIAREEFYIAGFWAIQVCIFFYPCI